MLAALRGPNATESVVGGLNRRKVIYLAPNRALVAEKARDWRARFGQIGITFAELTGDQDFGGDIWGEIENVDVILATPESSTESLVSMRIGAACPSSAMSPPC